MSVGSEYMRALPAVVLVCGVVLGSVSAHSQAPDLKRMDLVLRSVPDGPVAKVNGQNISREEYVGLYQSELAAAMVRSRTSDIADRQRLDAGIRALVLLVQRELLYQEALKRKFQIDQKELDERWAAELERLKKATPENKDKEPTEEEILRLAGATREQAIAEFRKALLVEKAREEIAKENKAEVADKDIAQFFNENKEAFKRPDALHLKQVFLNARQAAGAPGADPQNKAKAREAIENALKRIQAGERFEAVAKEVSQAPDREKGGDMGLMPTAALPPFLVEAAGAMRPGEVSGILESEWGYHVIKLIEAVPGADASLEKAKPTIRRMLLAQKTNDAVDEFCRKLMDEPGCVEVYLQLDKTLATHPNAEKLIAERAEPQ